MARAFIATLSRRDSWLRSVSCARLPDALADRADDVRRPGTRPIIVRRTLPITCPVSTADRAIAMVRNRSMMPWLVSVATATAVALAE
jgi:hypothetical protein